MTIDKGIYIQNIYYMMAYAFNSLEKIEDRHLSYEDFDEIHDLLAEVLYLALAAQVKQGLHKEYSTVEEELPILKGKILVEKSFASLFKYPQRLYCEHDVFTEDCLLNQILKTTIFYIIRCNNVDSHRKSRLKSLLPYFDNVKLLEKNNIRWSNIRFNKDDGNYKALINLCYFIIDGILPTTEDGVYKLEHFEERNMPRLYEKFILEYYKRHHPELKPSAKVIEWNITKSVEQEELIPNMHTDVTLTFPKGYVIIDAKYYGETLREYQGKKMLHSSNLYQIHTYVMNMDKSHAGNVHGVLLYAKTKEDIVPNGEMQTNDGNLIKFRTLDLSQKFENITYQLEQLVKDFASV